jgi:hypothetical protein
LPRCASCLSQKCRRRRRHPAMRAHPILARNVPLVCDI